MQDPGDHRAMLQQNLLHPQPPRPRRYCPQEGRLSARSDRSSVRHEHPVLGATQGGRNVHLLQLEAHDHPVEEAEEGGERLIFRLQEVVEEVVAVLLQHEEEREVEAEAKGVRKGLKVVMSFG